MNINESDGAIWWNGHLAVDADGSPGAYAPKGSGLPHLDNLDNAGHDGDWYGIETDTGDPTGKPLVQGPGDPFPGGYISTTALKNLAYPRTDPRHNVDSTEVSYLSVPSNAHHDFGITKGDVGFAYSCKTGQMSPGVVADIGPKNKWGEGSIKLTQNLGLPDSPINGGAESGVIMVVFKGSSRGWPRTNEDVAQQVQDLIDANGGTDFLRAVGVVK